MSLYFAILHQNSKAYVLPTLEPVMLERNLAVITVGRLALYLLIPDSLLSVAFSKVLRPLPPAPPLKMLISALNIIVVTHLPPYLTPEYLAS
jgi:hypothetical protein